MATEPTFPAPDSNPEPKSQRRPMSERAKTQILVAIISGIVSIIVAMLGTFVALRSSGSQINTLDEKAKNIKKSIDYIATPPGTIAAYGGPLSPEELKKQGWLFCNGDPVSRSDFKDLHDQIGDSWGRGDGVKTFNLPDLRGVFLRGVSEKRADKFGDPEANTRINLADGGNAKNNVGSYQHDEVGQHNHDYLDGQPHNEDGDRRDTYDRGGNDAVYSKNYPKTTIPMKGHVETRPKNAYVYYIIKY